MLDGPLQRSALPQTCGAPAGCVSAHVSVFLLACVWLGLCVQESPPVCAVHTCARSSLLTEQAHTCAGHWAGDGPAQASGMTARHTCGWGGWGTQPWTWTRAKHLGGASMTWSWWAGPRGCCWGQVFKGLGPHGMSQAPTATRLGLPGAAAGYRGPLRTFEQEADDVTMVPGVCEGGELSVLEGANRGHERRPQEVVAACSGCRKLGRHT